MISPVGAISSQHAISGFGAKVRPVAFKGATQAYENQMNRFEKGEKLNINCCGTREYSVCGQNLDYLA